MIYSRNCKKKRAYTLIGLIAAGCLILFDANADTSKPSIIVFDLELVDTSLEHEMYGENPTEIRRLAQITKQLREGLKASGKYEVLDNAPAAEIIQKLRSDVRFLHDCNNCELEVARSLGAELSLVGWVQKVSNLILNLNVVIKDVISGKVEKTAFVDIRGNTDRSWQHGIDYMLKHRLLISKNANHN
jgi:hypothetical protein